MVFFLLYIGISLLLALDFNSSLVGSTSWAPSLLLIEEKKKRKRKDREEAKLRYQLVYNLIINHYLKSLSILALG